MMSQDSVKKSYFCNVCGKNHEIMLQKRLLEGREKFPFTYVYLHGDLYNILTTLYLDANLNIRGTEIVRLDDSENIFDKDQMMNIVKNLTSELNQLQNDYNELLKKYNELKQK